MLCKRGMVLQTRHECRGSLARALREFGALPGKTAYCAIGMQ